MATNPETSEDYARRLGRESAVLEAETRRLKAEADKLLAEQYRAAAKEDWLQALSRRPAIFFAFALGLAIAIMGLGAILATTFLR